MSEAASAPSPSHVGVFDEGEARAVFEGKLGVTFKDTQLLELALTHRSYAYENELTETNWSAGSFIRGGYCCGRHPV